MNDTAKLALFEQAIVPHLNAAYNLARWMTRNTHDAEDLVQESYVKAFRFLDGFHGVDGRAWLLTIVRNTCLTWLRKSKAGGGEVLEFDERAHGTGRQCPTPETDMIDNWNLGSLRQCMEDLPPDFKEVIVMRELEEMSYKEIAAVVSVPMGTVMSRLSRARERLQDCVATRMRGQA
jgi:RNA polymerase sigma-70 factor (ECF subfamily)